MYSEKSNSKLSSKHSSWCISTVILCFILDTHHSVGFCVNVLGYNHTSLCEVIFCITLGILYWLKVPCNNIHQTLTEVANHFRAHQLWMYSLLKYSLTWSSSRGTYSFKFFSLSSVAWISWSLVLLVRDWSKEGIQYHRLVIQKFCLARFPAPLSSKPLFCLFFLLLLKYSKPFLFALTSFRSL